MENIVEQIHREIDEAHIHLVERLENQKIKISEEKEGLTNEDLEVYRQLKAFSNIPIKEKVNEIVEKEKQIKQKSELNNSAKEAINIHKKFFPFNRFIDLTELYKILEKYSLFLGHESSYIGNIPIENAKKIIEFDKKLKELFIHQDNHGIKIPLCVQENSNYNNYPHYSGYYIVAPRKDFRKELLEIGKELIYPENIQSIRSRIEEMRRMKLEDPIVLMPIFFRKKILLTIVTKWGPEAVYPEFQNPIEN